MDNQFYIETLEIAGFASALQAMRLPMKSEKKSDSNIKGGFIKPNRVLLHEDSGIEIFYNVPFLEIGPKDFKLLQNLIRSGDEHGKVMRGIHVWFEINAPRYFHVELDTYRIGAERLSSESTMHCECKNFSGEELQKAKGKNEESHMQKRIWDMSYQTIRRLRFQRLSHRLPEWHQFIEWIDSLPLAKQLITINPWWQDKIDELENKIKQLKGE